jgi:hypothetical protein
LLFEFVYKYYLQAIILEFDFHHQA